METFVNENILTILLITLWVLPWKGYSFLLKNGFKKPLRNKADASADNK